MKRRIVSLILIIITGFSVFSIQVNALTPTYTVSPEYMASGYYKALTAVTLTGNQRQDLVNIALSQVGYHEGNSTLDLGGGTLGTGNYTEFGRFCESINGPWCGYFISWCARQAKIPKSIIKTTGAANCDSFGAEWHGRNSERSESINYTPQPGDIIVYDWGPPSNTPKSTYEYSSKSPASAYGDHVGIVTHVDSSKVYVVEGNTGKYCVEKKTRGLSWSEIKGYAVPNYANDSVIQITQNPPTLSISDQTTPSSLNVGDSFGVRGIITTNCGKITSVHGTIINSYGEVVQSGNYTPNATSHDLRYSLNNALLFDKLSAGTYTYKVTASATNGNQARGATLIDCSFTVKSTKLDPAKSEAVDYVNVSVSGTNVTVTWSQVASAKSYDVYLVQGPWGWENIKYSKTGLSSSTAAWTFSNVAIGDYAAFVISRPNADNVQSEWKSFSVKNSAGTATIQYDANGGSGVPGSLTVNKDKDGIARFSLSMTKPIRSGYTFLGWRLFNDTTYNIDSPGQSIAIGLDLGGNTTLTYYAQWSAALA